VAVQVTGDDIRLKRFKQKAGRLIIFVVDASGSMAANRMNQAKGALIRLLREAYLHRDKVALISFRGDGAEVLLPPSRSVELAKRALDRLPAGGGTPLAAGLLTALDLAKRERRNGLRHTMLVLLTDGRANVSRQRLRRASLGVNRLVSD
jgi:magnesium chelatase subunit D